MCRSMFLIACAFRPYRVTADFDLTKTITNWHVRSADTLALERQQSISCSVEQRRSIGVRCHRLRWPVHATRPGRPFDAIASYPRTDFELVRTEVHFCFTLNTHGRRMALIVPAFPSSSCGLCSWPMIAANETYCAHADSRQPWPMLRCGTAAV